MNKNRSKSPVVKEPVRTSLFDVIKKNLKSKDFVITDRLIIGAEFIADNIIDIASSIQTIVLKTYEVPREKATGILLLYDSYFCLILDAYDETLYFIVKTFYNEMATMLKRIKVLTFLSQINDRITDEFLIYYGKPLVGNIDYGSQNNISILQNCIQKLLQLGVELNKKKKQIILANYQCQENIELKRNSLEEDEFVEYLPYVQTLNYVLELPHVLEITKFIDIFDNPKSIFTKKDEIWSTSITFIPQLLNITPHYDPPTELPKISNNQRND